MRDGDKIYLEFSDAAQTKKIFDVTSLTSGALPADRFPTSGIPGAGLELIERKDVSQASDVVDSFKFDNLLDDTVYRIVGEFKFVNEYGDLTYSFPKIEWLDENGNKQDDIAYSRWYGNGDAPNSKIRDHIDCSVGNSTYYYSSYISTVH